MRISQPKWRTYIECLLSGECNIKDPYAVARLSQKISETPLTRIEVVFCMRHYRQLRATYGISGVNIDIRSLK